MSLLDFFGNGADDPRSQQILGLAQGLMSGGLPGGIEGMNRAREMTMREKLAALQAKGYDLRNQTDQMQLDDMRRKSSDADQARDVLRGVMSGQGTPMGGMPGAAPGGSTGAPAALPGFGSPSTSAGVIPPKSEAWMRYKATGDALAAKGLVDAAQQQYSLAEKFRPKYSTTPQVVRDPQTGQLVNILVGEDGSTSQLGYGVRPDMQVLSLGDRQQAVDKNSLQNNQAFTMGQSPDSRASNAIAIRGQNMTDARARESAANAKLQYDPERGGVVDLRTGSFTPATQGGAPIGAKDKPLTDTQAKALQFSSRMENSHNIIGDLAQKGAVNLFPGTDAGYGIGRVVRGVSPAAGQQLEQAQRDFVNAILRRESGAAIGRDEFDNAKTQYFPQIGDSKEVIAQKTRNREIAIAGLKAEVPKSAPGVDDFMPNGKRSAISSGGWSAKRVD